MSICRNVTIFIDSDKIKPTQYLTFFLLHSVFAPLSRIDAELIQQQAPPSYGQLIAQGAIPPVDDFPTESPSDVSLYMSTINVFWCGLVVKEKKKL